MHLNNDALPMLFNPKAARLTFNRLRDIAITSKPQLKGQLDECLRGKALQQDVYLTCQKTESDQRAFDGAINLWDERIERIDQAAYRTIREELLLTEGIYGFGTPLPVTPQSPIEVIPPNYWLFLETNTEKAEAFGHRLHYVGVFFQRKEDVPSDTIALVKARQSNTAIATPEVDAPPKEKVNGRPSYYTSPYLQLMLEAAEHFNINETNPPMKKDITGWFKEKSAKKGIELSERMVEILATAIRPPESQKGGLKAQSKIIQRGDAVKQPQDA